MATVQEFEHACPTCTGPGIYAIEDRYRLRVGLTSNLLRFVRRQRTPVRILYVVRLEPGRAVVAWRSLLGSLRIRPKECQFDPGAARDVARSLAEVARHGSMLTAADIRGAPDSVASTELETEDLPPIFRRVLDEIGAE